MPKRKKNKTNRNNEKVVSYLTPNNSNIPKKPKKYVPRIKPMANTLTSITPKTIIILFPKDSSRKGLFPLSKKSHPMLLYITMIITIFVMFINFNFKIPKSPLRQNCEVAILNISRCWSDFPIILFYNRDNKI